jgi:hypothetical protein
MPVSKRPGDKLMADKVAGYFVMGVIANALRLR